MVSGLISSGCGHWNSGESRQKDFKTDVEAPSAESHESAPQTLMNAFQFVEQTEKGEIYQINPLRSIVPVDINSSMAVKINPQKFPAASLPLSTLQLDDVAAKRNYLLGTLKNVERCIEISESLHKKNEELFDGKGAPRFDKTKAPYEAFYQQFESLASERGDLYTNIYDDMMRYVALKDHKPITTEDPTDDLSLSRWINSRYPAFNARPESIDFASFIKAQISGIESEMQLREKKIRDVGQEANLRLQARIFHKNDPPVHFHLPGYDTIEAGVPSFKDKMSFRLDEKAKEELRQEVRFHAQFAETYNSLSDKSSEYLNSLSKTLNILQKEVAGLIFSVKSEVRITGFDELCDNLLKKVSELENKIENQTARQKVVNLKKSIITLKGQVEALMDDLDKLRNLTWDREVRPEWLLVDLPQMKIDQTSDLTKKLYSLINPDNDNSFSKMFAEIDKSLKEVKEDSQIQVALTDELNRMIIEKIKTSFPKTRKRLEFHKKKFEKVSSLARGIKKYLKSPVYLSSIADEEMSKPVSLEQVTDTSLELIRTDRRENDIIELSAKLTSDGESIDSQRFFKICKFGLHTKVSGNVIFVDRVSTPPGEKENNFVAAPAVSYIYRYRSREQSRSGEIWNFFNPGLGLNAAALNFQSGGVELGVGGVFTLFSDILQFGYGYNLQVDSDNEYIFIGLGITELLNAYQNPPTDFQVKSQ